MVEALRTAFREGREREHAQSRPGPLGWVLSVPDTHQRTELVALEAAEDIRVVTCATEDEAHAINAGLHMGGQQAALVIQHAGVFASVNTLRGVSMDGRIPTFYLVGLLGRQPDVDPRDAKGSMLRYCEPLLDTFGVPNVRLDGPDDLPVIPEYYRLSRERRGPAAVLVGMRTA
jgi:sulfopyruvate decarboxylase TPP-binding subunit